MVGEPSAFFESSSELPTSFAWRNGKPKLRRRDAAEALLLALGVDDVVVVAGGPVSLDDSFERFPYLFFRYRAHELNAAPSCASVELPIDLSGEASRFFNACDERLRDKSLPLVPNAEDVDAPP